MRLSLSGHPDALVVLDWVNFPLEDVRGGGVDRLTEAQRTLIAQATTLQIQSERVQRAVLRGELVDVEQLTRLANAATRILSRLGLKREQRDATPSLAEYLAANDGEAAA